MLFKFQEYLTPIWFYNLKSIGDIPYFIDYRKLSTDKLQLIEIDSFYQLENSRIADAAYQAIQKGIMEYDKTKGFEQRFDLETPLVNNINDNYRFIRKYFSTHWYIYVLILRILSLNNPLKEIKGFFKSINIKKLDSNLNHLVYSEYINFESPLIQSNPKITVVIPTLNRYQYLHRVLQDLEAQDYKNFEVFICDQTEPIDIDFYNGWNLDLKLIKQQEKALWLARNRCIKESTGEYMLLYDDDSIVECNWISEHIKCIDYFKADISAGISVSVVGGKPSRDSNYFHWSSELDTGNVLIPKYVFQKTGLFDRQFEKQRMGDGEFGIRSYLNGFTIISNPYAKRIHLKVSTGGLRQMGSWDAFRPKELFSPRPVPSTLYLSRKYFGNKLSVLWLFISIPPSIIPYKYKKNRWLKSMGYLLTLIVFPIILIQVIISWRHASAKLKKGALIDKF